jgi:acyl-CoA dehydrogenase
MRRDIFTEEHEMFRAQVAKFVDNEIVPKIEQWNRNGMSDRESWRKMGAAGFLGANAPVEYGGAGADFAYDAIVNEELARVRAHGLMMGLHSDICMPYISTFGNEEQKRRYLPGAISGELILAIGMTEPGTGSDLAAVQTTARRDGDSYVINGSKIFISNGQIANLIIVVAKTDPKATPAHRGISLILVERLVTAIGATASTRRCLEDTIAYTKQRRAFGQPIATFQNTQFKLAEMATELEVGQAFVDRLIAAHIRGDDVVTEVSMAKWWTTEMLKRTASQCLQLHGGYGFMMEYPVATDYADAAVQSIYAGTNEIMKVIIARRMGLDQRG